MQHNEQMVLAAKLLKTSIETIVSNSETIEGAGILYISIPIKGGDSLIVGADGSVLYADSSVGYTRHLQEFESGNRTPLEAFENETAATSSNDLTS